MNEKYDGWAIHDGKGFIISSIRKTKEDAELHSRYYMGHTSKLLGRYRLAKVKIVEVGGERR